MQRTRDNATGRVLVNVVTGLYRWQLVWVVRLRCQDASSESPTQCGKPQDQGEYGGGRSIGKGAVTKKKNIVHESGRHETNPEKHETKFNAWDRNRAGKGRGYRHGRGKLCGSGSDPKCTPEYNGGHQEKRQEQKTRTLTCRDVFPIVRFS